MRPLPLVIILVAAAGNACGNDAGVTRPPAPLAKRTPGGDFVVTKLPTLGGTTRETGINDDGIVAGFSNLPGTAGRHAAFWTNGSIADMGTLGGQHSSVVWPGLTNNGMIAGISETAATNPLNEDWSCSAFFPTTTHHICLGFELVARIVRDLGEPLATGIPALTRLAPTAERIADAGPARLRALAVPPQRADAVGAVSRAIADGTVDVGIGGDVNTMRRMLIELGGMDGRLATMTVMRTHHWPDAFPEPDRVLQRAAGASSARELRTRAEQWRSWRAYAAQHLWLHAQHSRARTPIA